jgi:hypothetical protein
MQSTCSRTRRFEETEGAAVQAAPLQLGEPPLDLADPGRVRGREVQLDAGVGQQP